MLPLSRLRIRFARLLLWIAVGFLLVGLYVLLIGGFHITLPLVEISLTAPSHLWVIFFALTAVGLLLGPVPMGESPLVRFYLWLKAQKPGVRRICLVLLLLPLFVLALGRAYQSVQIARAEHVMARGETLLAAKYFKEGAKWPFGASEHAKAYRARMLFVSQKYQQCVDENIEDFRSDARIGKTRYRVYWECLEALGRYEEALRVLQTSMVKYASMVQYAPAGELIRRQMLSSGGPPGRRVPVRFSFETNVPGSELRLRGSFTRDGRQSDVEGWQKSYPLVTEGGRATLEIPLALSDRLPYAALLEHRQGESWGPLSMAHFWVSGEDGFVAADLQRLTDHERPPRSKWVRAPGDGRARTVVIWPDGGSWFLINTLAERGALPNIERFLEESARGKMISTHPPLTATAYLKMVRVDGPAGSETLPSDESFWDMLALQLKGIPFLDWAFAEDVGALGADPRSIFNILQNNGYSTVNLVFSDKYMSAPSDAGVKIEHQKSEDFADLELEQILLELKIDPVQEPERAAQIDDSISFQEAYNNTSTKAKIGASVWSGGKHDFMLLRFPAVDLMSHTFAADAFEEATGSLLFETYRQLDLAMGQFMELVDADDTLILVSDHGVESALSHHPDCLLAVSGPGVQAGALLPQVSIGELPHIILSRFDTTTGEEAMNPELARALYGDAVQKAPPSGPAQGHDAR